MLVRRYEMPWRRAYEVYAGVAWWLALVYFIGVGVTGTLPRQLALPLALVASLGLPAAAPAQNLFAPVIQINGKVITMISADGQSVSPMTTMTVGVTVIVRISAGTYPDRYGASASNPRNSTVDASSRRPSNSRGGVRDGSVSESSARARNCAITRADARCAYRSCPNVITTLATSAHASTTRWVACTDSDRRDGSTTSSDRIDAVIAAETMIATTVPKPSSAVTTM